ncbi:hypothetical protein Tco_0668869 [Tanacetum coccineum]
MINNGQRWRSTTLSHRRPPPLNDLSICQSTVVDGGSQWSTAVNGDQRQSTTVSHRLNTPGPPLDNRSTVGSTADQRQSTVAVNDDQRRRSTTVSHRQNTARPPPVNDLSIRRPMVVDDGGNGSRATCHHLNGAMWRVGPIATAMTWQVNDSQ